MHVKYDSTPLNIQRCVLKDNFQNEKHLRFYMFVKSNLYIYFVGVRRVIHIKFCEIVKNLFIINSARIMIPIKTL